jgi:hypothetical protein
MNLRVVAAGQDRYWLTAVRKALISGEGEVKLFRCPRDLQKCIPKLPCPDRDTILLVDASSQSEVAKAVEELRTGGWRYVIVVAADPSAKEATAVLRRNLGYDYWEKTYDKVAIRERVEACFLEIAEARKRKKRHVTPRNRFE